MTTAKFIFQGKTIVRFDISGHSTENANDINGKLVCSAISSAAYMAANTLIEIAKCDVETEIDEGFMSVSILNNTEIAQVILNGLYIHLIELEKQYKKHIKIYSEV